ncbi:two-component sensor histidine kinase [Kibdelosporangium aridum]|uniref:histidine kinase n=1 Tax=Kibdelosporangium aridum TaxID=2030 RepID=A0A428ZRX0_KIBAR|nr:histidine kinase [Kibdelosporangium aridum]RSM90805.1 two-component sensor histidine kinase [Kibdelosporangium aridum]
MLGFFDRLSWVQRVTTAVLFVAAVAFVIFEGLSVDAVPGAIGIVICGLLPLAALLTSTLSAWVVSGIAVLSIAFTIVCPQLPVPPDNTFGMIELLGLAILVVRVVIQFRPRRSAWLTMLLFAAATVLPLRLDSYDRIEYMIAVIVAVMGFLVLLGMYVRLYDRRRSVGFELERQTQRLEYARDLHDFVAHHVTAIVAQAKAVRFTTAAGMAPSPKALDEMLAGIEKAGSEALVSMRSMITVLREDSAPVRPHQTLGSAVATAAENFAGPPVTVSIDSDLAARELPQETLNAAKHVVQESLTNILRHAAEVTRVEVSAADTGGSLEITVTNDGIAASNGLPSGGFGLVGLAERVESVGGHLNAGSTGAGWAVTAVLPSSRS